MKNFKTTQANVEFEVETLKFQDNNEENSTMVQCKSKSELFKRMYDAGVEINEISRECKSHYSFVYGVISTKRELRKNDKPSASDEIRKMAAEGKTPGDIAKELNKNYSFVFSVVKKYKETLVVPEAAVAVVEETKEPAKKATSKKTTKVS